MLRLALSVFRGICPHSDATTVLQEAYLYRSLQHTAPHSSTFNPVELLHFPSGCSSMTVLIVLATSSVVLLYQSSLRSLGSPIR